MKKLLNLLLASRPETENKWWHRLVSVIVFGSTILVSIFAMMLFVSNSEIYKKHSYIAFSFEDSYSAAKGTEVDCTIEVKPFDASCGGEKFDTSDLVKKYNSMIRDYLGVSTIDQICPISTVKERSQPGSRLTIKDISCIRIRSDLVPISSGDFYIEVDGQVIYDSHLTDDQTRYLTGLWSKLLLLKAKRTTEIIYPVFFQNMIYVILATLGWFIFWKLVVYRTLLYIVFGKRK